MEEKDLEKIVQDHEKRILELEKNYSEVKKEITVVQTSQSKIEGMLYDQNTEQKELIEKHQKNQTALLDTLLSHTLGIRQESHKQKWQIIGAMVGGGGILYVVIEVAQSFIN